MLDQRGPLHLLRVCWRGPEPDRSGLSDQHGRPGEELLLSPGTCTALSPEGPGVR